MREKDASIQNIFSLFYYLHSAINAVTQENMQGENDS